MFYLGITDRKGKGFTARIGENFSISNAFDVLRSVRQEGLWATRVSFIYSVAKNKVYYVLNNVSKILQSINSNITAIINKSGGFTFPPLP